MTLHATKSTPPATPKSSPAPFLRDLAILRLLQSPYHVSTLLRPIGASMKPLILAAILAIPSFAIAQPVQLTCTSVTSSSISAQLTFDESNGNVAWGSSAPVRATFSAQEIDWSMPPDTTNELKRSQDVMQYNHHYASNVQQFNCAVAQQRF